MKKIGYLLLLGVMISACTKNNFEDMMPEGTCKDTVGVISFTEDVLPILKKNCVTCHYLPANSQNKNVVLENYDEVMKVVNSGQIYKALNHLNGATPMPYQIGKLDECTRAKINKWINSGAPNN